MTREEVYSACKTALTKSNVLLLEAATGLGKSKISIDLINWIAQEIYKSRKPKMFLLVAKRVHKQTWKDEFDKWGGIKADVTMECYESLQKHTGESFDFILLDECFRGDTEILTNSGYKQFKDLTEEDLVAQFTQEGNIEFVKPLRLIKRRHTGEICKLHLGRERYCYLTPNHNMVYKTPWVDGWRMKPVKDLTSYSDITIPVSGKGTGCNESLTPLDRLLIAVQADGGLQRHQLHCSVYSVAVKKERKKERLKSILSQLSNWTKIDNYRDYDRYLVQLPIGDAKLLSTHFEVNMGYDRANAFIDEVLEWDGSKACGGNTVYYSSKIKENADFVAAVAIQAGYKVLQSVEEDDRKDNHSPIYRLFMRKLEGTSTQPMTKEYIPYDDDVYCVEVPTHMIVVRSEGYSFIAGNCHHIASEKRMQELKTLKYGYMIGLSATIPRNVKAYFRFNFHSQVVSCDIIEAIEAEVLPEPTILLFPLQVENTKMSETIEVNKPKQQKFLQTWVDGKDPNVIYGDYKDYWKYKKSKQHAILRCTQKQKLMELDKTIEWFKKKAMTGNQAMKQTWLYFCGKRLEFLADCKLQWVKLILHHLDKERTITFCKTISQTEQLGKNCIHSQNKDATKIYERFNAGKIDHITAVNILNENANLVNCRYGIFCNITSSEIITQQRQGRLLRHKDPVMVIPYYKGTREEELVLKAIEGFSKVKTIQSISEI